MEDLGVQRVLKESLKKNSLVDDVTWNIGDVLHIYFKDGDIYDVEFKPNEEQQALRELESKVTDIRDKLDRLGFSVVATMADDLKNTIASAGDGTY